MANMNYHKVYMNQIHSSNLLCELAQMWKSQSLCDAVIKTGTVTTKAHRLVLVAACPMLKSMENASVGSHLEVRLASDIKQDSVNTFLQYLYEGVMMLTEENFKDIEKIARILQVDSVIKCCADFYKCLHSKSQYKYDYNDHIEFKHVRQTDLLKNSDRVTKRNLDSTQPSSPGGKRQRMQMSKGAGGDVSILGVSHKADDRISMAHSYMSNDPPFRTHRMGPASVSRVKSNVVDVVEDSVEIVHTEKDPGGSKRPAIDTNSALSISVASQITSGAEVQVVNVSSNGNNATTTTTSSASSEPKSTATQDSSTSKVPVRPQLAGPFTSDKPPDPVSTSTPLRIQKSFAAGSAMQAAAAAFSSTTPCSSPSANQVTGGQEMSKESSSKSTPEPPRCSSADLSPDLSIVKKEQVGLDMHVDIQQEPGEEASSDVEFEESSQEEGNMSLDQAAMNWYQGQAFKEPPANFTSIRRRSLEGENLPYSTSGTQRDQNTKENLLSDPKHTDQIQRLPYDPTNMFWSESLSLTPDIFQSTVSTSPMEGPGIFESSVHRTVRCTGTKYKPCALCQMNKIRTKSGWHVYTYFKCEACDMPFCISRQRNCFNRYHKYINVATEESLKVTNKMQ